METSVIIGLLVIAAVWSVYLLPVVFGDRKDGSISSTDEFDRWSHTMADVQRHTPADLASGHRDLIRIAASPNIACPDPAHDSESWPRLVRQLAGVATHRAVLCLTCGSLRGGTFPDETKPGRASQGDTCRRAHH